MTFWWRIHRLGVNHRWGRFNVWYWNFWFHMLLNSPLTDLFHMTTALTTICQTNSIQHWATLGYHFTGRPLTSWSSIPHIDRVTNFKVPLQERFSCCSTCLDCSSSTLAAVLGFSRSSLDLRQRLNSNSLGKVLVVCGVNWYANNTVAIRLRIEPFWTFFNPRLTTWTARSASPLVAGWYGADSRCLTPFCLRNIWNSLLVKQVPLSDTMLSGTPNRAKRQRSSSITTLDAEPDVGIASIHFEWASMMSRIMWPWTGPAQSICSLAQGRVGHVQGCIGVAGGLAWTFWQGWQSFTASSTSCVILGHQTYILAKAFILAEPGWPSWSWLSTRFR